MKFQSYEPFEKHCKESFPSHISPIYVVIAPQESERKKILANLISSLENISDLKKCSLIKDAVEHVNAGSLFSGKMAALFDGAELLLKAEMEMLAHYIDSPNPEAHLILGAASSKNITELYKKGKKEMVVLDLSKEKPWEERARLQKWIVQTLHVEKKQVAPDAVEALLDRLPPDRLLLEQEIEKLLCFVGERPNITRQDVETICSSSIEYNQFQLAQQLVWGGRKQLPTLSDLSQLLPLVGQLRNQFEMGLKMSTLLKRGATKDEIGAAFPRLWPKALQQCLEGARKRGGGFFKKGLIDLFALELGLKTSTGKPEVLFAMFCARTIY